jgi:hypothetical protein
MSDLSSTDDDDGRELPPEGETDPKLIPPAVRKAMEAEVDAYIAEWARALGEYFDGLEDG